MSLQLPEEVNLVRHFAPIVPLYGITDLGACACGRVNCPRPGKHPIPRNGSKDATQDEGVLRSYLDGFPFLNWGMTLGDFWVLDVDPRNGGEDSLAKLQEEIGPFNSPLVQQSGGGGIHIFFRSRPLPLKGKLGAGLDIKTGPNQFIVIAPSRHVSGGNYKWML